MEILFFYLFAAVAVFSSIMVITSNVYIISEHWCSLAKIAGASGFNDQYIEGNYGYHPITTISHALLTMY